MSINLETLIPYDRILNSPDDVFDLVDKHGQVVLLKENAPAYVIIKSEAAMPLLKSNEQKLVMKSKHTLQEAMKIVLLEAENHTMHAAALAEAIYEKGLYYKKDGTKAGYNQVRARCSHYPDLFEVLEKNTIKLR